MGKEFFIIFMLIIIFIICFIIIRIYKRKVIEKLTNEVNTVGGYIPNIKVDSNDPKALQALQNDGETPMTIDDFNGPICPYGTVFDEKQKYNYPDQNI